MGRSAERPGSPKFRGMDTRSRIPVRNSSASAGDRTANRRGTARSGQPSAREGNGAGPGEGEPGPPAFLVPDSTLLADPAERLAGALSAPLDLAFGPALLTVSPSDAFVLRAPLDLALRICAVQDVSERCVGLPALLTWLSDRAAQGALNDAAFRPRRLTWLVGLRGSGCLRMMRLFARAADLARGPARFGVSPNDASVCPRCRLGSQARAAQGLPERCGRFAAPLTLVSGSARLTMSRTAGLFRSRRLTFPSGPAPRSGGTERGRPPWTCSPSVRSRAWPAFRPKRCGCTTR